MRGDGVCCISLQQKNKKIKKTDCKAEETQQGVWKPGVFFNVRADGLFHFKACCLCIGTVAC